MDGRLDFPVSKRPHPGDWARCTKAQTVHLSRALARNPRRKQIRTNCFVWENAAENPPNCEQTSLLARTSSKQSAGGDRTIARAQLHPRGQRTIRSRKQIVRPDDHAR